MTPAAGVHRDRVDIGRPGCALETWKFCRAALIAVAIALPVVATLPATARLVIGMAAVVTVLPPGMTRLMVNEPPVIVLAEPIRLEPNSLTCCTSLMLSGLPAATALAIVFDEPSPLNVKSPWLTCVPPV